MQVAACKNLLDADLGFYGAFSVVGFWASPGPHLSILKFSDVLGGGLRAEGMDRVLA